MSKSLELKQKEYEDKVLEAIEIIEDASGRLDAHGFIDYDSTYLSFALVRFQKDFEFVNERDWRKAS